MTKKITETSNPIFINGRFLTQEITGIQRFSYEICKALIRKGIDIIILTPKKVRSEYQLDCPIVHFGLFQGLLWEQVDLPLFLLKHRKPLLLNFGSPGPIFYSHRVITIHDLSFMVHPEWFSKSYAFYYRLISPVVARRSKKVITVSEFSKKELIHLLKIDEEKIAVIHNAVSDFFTNELVGESSIEGKYLLSVASLDPRKNLDRLVKAYKMANIENEVKLVFVGKGDPIFNTEPNREILLHSKGYVTDRVLAILYQHASIFIYPSLYEGFGLPPLEAMSMGCPVILSDIPVFKEIFGDAAHYIDPLDPKSIKEGINSLLNNEEYRQELILKGKERAKLYSWDRSVDRLISLINELS